MTPAPIAFVLAVLVGMPITVSDGPASTGREQAISKTASAGYRCSDGAFE